MTNQIDYTFKAAPTHDELREMDRDLRFYPSTVDDPTTLTTEQVAAFNRDGYLKGFRIFDDAEIAEHRAFFDEQLRKVLAAGHGSFTLSSAHLKFAKVYDLMHHPKILAYVHDLLGPELIGLASHYFCKMPKDGTTVSWHQDASYWPLTPSKTVTVWLAIDDADIDNGCMRFRRRLAPPRPARIPPERRLGKQRPQSDGGRCRALRRDRRCRAQGRRGLDSLRPAFAQLALQRIGSPALRINHTLLHPRRPRDPRLLLGERGRTNQRRRPGWPLGQPESARARLRGGLSRWQTTDRTSS